MRLNPALKKSIRKIQLAKVFPRSGCRSHRPQRVAKCGGREIAHCVEFFVVVQGPNLSVVSLRQEENGRKKDPFTRVHSFNEAFPQKKV